MYISDKQDGQRLVKLYIHRAGEQLESKILKYNTIVLKKGILYLILPKQSYLSIYIFSFLCAAALISQLMKIPLAVLLATSFFLMLPLMCILTILVRSSFLGSMLNHPQVRHLLSWLVDSVLFSCRQPILFEQNVSISEINLGVIRYEKKNWNLDEAAECVLCMYEIEEGGEIRDLRCKHLFHRRCLDRWLVQQLTCPLCRDCLSWSMRIQTFCILG